MFDAAAGFGGFKQSGYGRDGGENEYNFATYKIQFPLLYRQGGSVRVHQAQVAEEHQSDRCGC